MRKVEEKSAFVNAQKKDKGECHNPRVPNNPSFINNTVQKKERKKEKAKTRLQVWSVVWSMSEEEPRYVSASLLL